jgi:ribonuclease D
MLHYAAEDTRYLHRLADIIENRLLEKGRLTWATEEFALLELVRHSNATDQMLHFIREASNFNGRQLAALEKLLHWRDAEARRRNRRYFQIISNHQLTAIAENLPQTSRELVEKTKISPHLLKRYSEDILHLIRDVRQLPREKLPVPPQRERRSRKAVSNRLIKKLKGWRKEAAAHLELNPGTLINNSLLEEITRRKPVTLKTLAKVPGMKNWQVETLGTEIINLVTDHLAKN